MQLTVKGARTLCYGDVLRDSCEIGCAAIASELFANVFGEFTSVRQAVPGSRIPRDGIRTVAEVHAGTKERNEAAAPKGVRYSRKVGVGNPHLALARSTQGTTLRDRSSRPYREMAQSLEPRERVDAPTLLLRQQPTGPARYLGSSLNPGKIRRYSPRRKPFPRAKSRNS